MARAIHHSGCRADRPFVPVHCAALPEHLREAELFGHEKGAFTGADSSRIGRFEAADGGTLFLDEVACLDLQTQVKLLRVLEDRAVERVGSNERRTVDIRLIAATNEDLHPKVERGEFRRDVFFRLNVFPIVLPPLRERIEDVPLLADHFLKKLSEERNLPRKQFSSGALRALTTRSWPGNVRELSNLVETVALLVDAEVIEPGDLPVARDLAGASPVALAAGKGIKGALHEFERQMLRDAIQRAKGVKSVAARELGLDANQMKYLVRKHHLHDD